MEKKNERIINIIIFLSTLFFLVVKEMKLYPAGSLEAGTHQITKTCYSDKMGLLQWDGMTLSGLHVEKPHNPNLISLLPPTSTPPPQKKEKKLFSLHKTS